MGDTRVPRTSSSSSPWVEPSGATHRDSQILEQLGGVLLTNIVYPSLLLLAEDF